MARTTVPAVRDLLETTPTISLTPFIRTATALVDWLVTKDTNSVLTTSLLREIESYLAAHFYSHHDQPFTSKSTGGASGSFQGQTGYVFMGSKHGQTACALDVTGTLAALSKDTEIGSRRKASCKWLGKASDSVRPDGQ